MLLDMTRRIPRGVVLGLCLMTGAQCAVETQNQADKPYTVERAEGYIDRIGRGERVEEIERLGPAIAAVLSPKELEYFNSIQWLNQEDDELLRDPVLHKVLLALAPELGPSLTARRTIIFNVGTAHASSCAESFNDQTCGKTCNNLSTAVSDARRKALGAGLLVSGLAGYELAVTARALTGGVALAAIGIGVLTATAVITARFRNDQVTSPDVNVLKQSATEAVATMATCVLGRFVPESLDTSTWRFPSFNDLFDERKFYE